MGVFKKIGELFDKDGGGSPKTPYEGKNTKLAVAHLKMLGVDMVNKANAGHPGIVLGAAPIIYALYRNHIVVDAKDPKFFNRDRFVLSAGHGSALLYGMMHLAGFADTSIDQLEKFRQIHSKTPGHPENFLTAGVEATTGPLGQGVAMAVGMAMAESFLAAKFNTETAKPIGHMTYCLMGDGCLEEGVTQEAFALAGRYRLNKLVVLYDSNDVQLDGWVADSTRISVSQLMAAYEWNYHRVDNGTSVSEISQAIELAKKSNRPTLIEVKTVIGAGAEKQGTFEVHGAPIGAKDADKVREKLGLKTKPFEVDPEAYEDLAPLKVRAELAQKKYADETEKLKGQNAVVHDEMQRALSDKPTVELADFEELRSTAKDSTRNVAGKVLDLISKRNGVVFGGSADLSVSTKIKGANGNFDVDKRTGRNVNYGVREFAMVAANNGIALHGGVIPVGATFLAFLDYCKAAVRLGAISGARNITVFSHDSIFVGEDGPTHQPVEHIWTLRLIPDLITWRPANVEETVAAFKSAVERKRGPSAIVTSRMPFDFTKSTVEQALRGGYVLKPARGTPTLTLLATGSEVALAVQAAKDLEAANPQAGVAVVSMPSLEVFAKQGEDYAKAVLATPNVVSIEAGTTLPWAAYANHRYGVDRYGASGSPDQVRTEYKLNKMDVIRYVQSKGLA